MNKAFFLIVLPVIVLWQNALAQQSLYATQSKAAQIYNQDEARYASEDPYELPWGYVQWDNVLWQKRVWRDIDVRSDGNGVFNNNRNLGSVFIEGSLKGACKMYCAANERFTKELSRDEIIAVLSNGTGNGFNPAKTTKYRIKEDWLFLRDENKLVVRVVGIAPLRTVTTTDGKISEQPAFWIYYPETRNYLVQQKVTDPERPNILNWDELFEGHHFESKIERVTNGKPYIGN